jgi:hypothetical protein
LDEIKDLFVGHVGDFLDSGEFLGEGTPFFVFGLDIIDNDLIEGNKILFEANGCANFDDFVLFVFELNPFFEVVFKF